MERVSDDRDGFTGERRRGAMETSHALGELSALIRGLNDRMDRAQADIVRNTASQEAQLHEIKHDMRGQMQIMTSFDERLKAHSREVEENRRRAGENFDGIRNDFKDIKETSHRLGERLEDLMLWRNRWLGGAALIGVLLMVFSHRLVDWTVAIFTTKGP